MQSVNGPLTLRRWPYIADDALRAWDAADEYVLEHVQTLPLVVNPRVLIINDAHGALSTSLHAWNPVCWSDSWMSLAAARANWQLNGLDQDARDSSATCLPSMQEPQGLFDLVVIRIPKTTALLEDQLARLRAHLHKDSKIVAGAMVKHLQKSAFGCFEQYIGPVTTSLARKKARLLFAQYDSSLSIVASKYPSRYSDPDLHFELINYANVFARERLDHGARFLLQHVEQMPVSANVVDLACGNGVLGIRLQQIQPQAKLLFIDESWHAIQSAKESFQACFNNQYEGVDAPRFSVTDGLEEHDENAIDLILCNPPFHQQHAVGDHIAESMFAGMKRCLRTGGQAWIVGNRHLNYATRLKRLFGNCRVVDTNRKFSVFKVVKR